LIVVTLPGLAVIQASCAARNFPLNGPSLLHLAAVIDESSGVETLLMWYWFPLHREWNQECNDFNDCPLVKRHDLLWRFCYVSSQFQRLSRIRIL
jgi:hypothetical protein